MTSKFERIFTCQYCGKKKKESELGGIAYDFASKIKPTPADGKNAYCIKLAECDSKRSTRILKKITKGLDD